MAAVGDAKTSTGPMVWAIVGIAAVPATLLWAALARRVGWPIALAIALGVETLGTILPVLDGSSVTAMVTAALFGATFMGICMLTMECGQSLIGPNSAAPLTAVYGLGQVLGPSMVAPVVGEGYGAAFTIAFVVLACATSISVFIAQKTLSRR
ncbi:YbfB/YjiJ family MFS transporter [Rhodococcus fascians]|nr:YbfB/YjiJ family MFS transporter [Rhodococcus fascians]